MAPISLDRFKDIIKMRLDVYTSQEKNIHHLGFWDNYIKGGMIDPDFSKVSINYDEISVNVNPGFRPILDGKIIITEKKEEGLPLINVLKNIMYIDARIKELSKYVILENSRANNVRKPDSREWYIEKINSKFQEYKKDKITPPKIGKVYKDVDWFKVCCGLETYDEEYEKNVIKRLLPGDISGKEKEEVKELKEDAMDKLKDDQEKIKEQIKIQEQALKELEDNSVKQTQDDLKDANIIDPKINEIDTGSPEAKEELRKELSENIEELNKNLEKKVQDDITPQKEDETPAPVEPVSPTPTPEKPAGDEAVVEGATPEITPPPESGEGKGGIETPEKPAATPDITPEQPATTPEQPATTPDITPDAATPPVPDAAIPGSPEQQAPPAAPAEPPPAAPPAAPPPEAPSPEQQAAPPAQMGGAMTSACKQILNEIQEGGKITETHLLRAISAQHGGNECFI